MRHKFLHNILTYSNKLNILDLEALDMCLPMELTQQSI